MGQDIKISQEHQNEIKLFDALYRVNSKNGFSVLLDDQNEYLDPYLQALLNQKMIVIQSNHQYALTELGKKILSEYGKAFQRFCDLSIFKCVFPDAEAPQSGQPDQRFGGFDSIADPPHSEDYRFAIFENFAKREKYKAPFHLISYYLLMLNTNIEGEDWAWKIKTGEIFLELEDIINSQVSVKDITPEDWNENEMIDLIYEAGMKELERCFNEDREKYSMEQVQKPFQSDFDDDDHIENSTYYEPYFANDYLSGAGMLIATFAGISTLALLS